MLIKARKNSAFAYGLQSLPPLNQYVSAYSTLNLVASTICLPTQRIM